MPLIDRSYFIGELDIPNTHTAEIQERLDWFIEKHEPQLLRDLLGYPLSKAFMTGLMGAPVEQKWIDLLEGVEYTDLYGNVHKWMGLVSQPIDLINALDASNSIAVIVGRGQQYDPVVGANSVTIPPALVGKEFIVVQRTYGQLLPSEYSIVGNTLTLTAPTVFEIGDVYFYKSATLALGTVTGSVKQSLIANYIYYHWHRDQATQSVGIGEVATKAENATRVSPAVKMVRAWNEMIDWIKEMVLFLDTRRADYPEWDDQDRHFMRRKFWYINEFNI